MGKQPNYMCSQIGQVAGEIIVGKLCTKYRYTQISEGNWERGNWTTTCAVKSGKRLAKSLLDTYVISTSTRTYQKASGKGKTGQPPV